MDPIYVNLCNEDGPEYVEDDVIQEEPQENEEWSADNIIDI